MTGLIGWWPLHENSGTTAHDLSGNGNHGTLNGGVTQGVAGKAGLTAYSFDGENDYIRTASSITGVKSISFWIYAFDTIDEGSYTESYDGAVLANSSADYPVFWLGSFSSNTTGEVLNFYTGGKEGVYTKNHTLQGNKWHHIVINNQNGHWEIYANNEKIDTEIRGTPPDKASFSNKFEIGARTNRSQYGKHNLNDFRIYNRSLTPQEIQTLYEWGSGDYTKKSLHDGSDSGAVSRWKFDNSSGSSTATDKWGSNDGTINGATYTDDSIRGNALQFDGSGDDISINGLTQFSAYSISMWFKPDDANSSGSSFLAQLQENNNIQIYTGSSSPVTFRHDGTNTSMPYTDNQWHHLVGVWDGSKLYLYGNSQLQDSTSVSTTSSNNSQANIGSWNSSSSYYAGKIDDLRIYNRALSTSEVFQLYQWGTRGRDMRKLTVNARGGD